MYPTAPVAKAFSDAYAGPYQLPEVSLMRALHAAHPHAHLTFTPDNAPSLIQYARAGHASAESVLKDGALTRRSYLPPARRLDGGSGSFAEDVEFDVYSFRWHERSWILYIATGRDGVNNFSKFCGQFLVSGDGATNGTGVSGRDREFGKGFSKTQLQAEDDLLLKAVGDWRQKLSEEIWVFNQGFWKKDHDLYKSVAKAKWENVILDDEKKSVIQNDSARFFDNRARYDSLGVPWKRGVIFHGPPGNGKTISIKALMNTLYHRKEPVLGLLVRSLASFGGPEMALQTIFEKARTCAPCLLVFEDLDSLITPEVRSFFLNEVDGLAANDGIYMLGSTNHLDRLDPGLSKRPSRFDRKYEFPKPNADERRQYAEFWRGKVQRQKTADDDDDWEKDFKELRVSPLGGGPDDDAPKLEWPRELCAKMADITAGFSFAYMQEAFVATLLTLASEDEDKNALPDQSENGLEQLRLWKEFKKQVITLRKEIDDDEEMKKF